MLWIFSQKDSKDFKICICNFFVSQGYSKVLIEWGACISVCKLRWLNVATPSYLWRERGKKYNNHSAQYSSCSFTLVLSVWLRNIYITSCALIAVYVSLCILREIFCSDQVMQFLLAFRTLHGIDNLAYLNIKRKRYFASNTGKSLQKVVVKKTLILYWSYKYNLFSQN